MVFAGVSHLLWARREFQAQVPDSAVAISHLDKDTIVLASGVAEVALGVGLVAIPANRRKFGRFLAAFFVAVFPGNIAQFINRRDGFGLDTDVKRLVRLFFQPALVWWALWSTSPKKAK